MPLFCALWSWIMFGQGAGDESDCHCDCETRCELGHVGHLTALQSSGLISRRMLLLPHLSADVKVAPAHLECPLPVIYQQKSLS